MKRYCFVLLIVLSTLSFSIYAKDFADTEAAYTEDTNSYGFYKTSQIIPGANVAGGDSTPWVYDWDHDGTLDLLIATYRMEIYIYHNEGKGDNGIPVFSYEGKVELDDGSTEFSSGVFTLSMADMNGDNSDDLIIGLGGYGSDKGKLRIYTNSVQKTESDKNWTPIYSKDYVECKFMTNTTGITLSKIGNSSYKLYGLGYDYDGDGKNDLIVGYDYYPPNRITIAIATSDYGVFKVSGISNVSGKDQIQGITIDGTSDWHTYSKKRTTVYPFPIDWDHDGDMDIILTYDSGYNWCYSSSIPSYHTVMYTYTRYMYLECTNSANRLFKSTELKMNGERVRLNTYPTACVVTNKTAFNSDYNLILSGDYTGAVFAYKINEAPGQNFSDPDNALSSFKPATLQLVQGEYNKIYVKWDSTPEMIDLDGDGDLDLFVSSQLGLTYFLNENSDSSISVRNANPVFKEIKYIHNEDGNIICNRDSEEKLRPQIYNFDSDNKPDLMISGYSTILYFKGISGLSTNLTFGAKADTNIFILQVDGADISGSQLGHIMQCDWNNDGDYDYLVGSHSDGTISLYTNDGTTNNNGTPKLYSAGTIKDKDTGNDIIFGSEARMGYFIDFDGDELKDLLIPTDSTLMFFKNSGSSSSPKFSQNGSPVHLDTGDAIKQSINGTVWIGDLGGDDDYSVKYLDIVLGNTLGIVKRYLGVPPRYVSEDAEDLAPAEFEYVYPNPVREGNIVNFRVVVREDSLASIEIYNLAGKCITTISGWELRYDKDIPYELDISNFVNGTYIAVITITAMSAGIEPEKLIRYFSVMR